MDASDGVDHGRVTMTSAMISVYPQGLAVLFAGAQRQTDCADACGTDDAPDLRGCAGGPDGSGADAAAAGAVDASQQRQGPLPGLPFAKAEAVQHLRDQLSGKATSPAAVKPLSDRAASPSMAAPAAAAATAAGAPFPWGIALAGTAGLGGPQFFGNGNPAAPGGMPSAGSGIGGKIVGGLATGLAVGAGVMAAQAIGKSLLGDNDHPQHPPASAPPSEAAFTPGSSDLDGENFGIGDSGSWDDGGGASDDGDWDR